MVIPWAWLWFAAIPISMQEQLQRSNADNAVLSRRYGIARPRSDIDTYARPHLFTATWLGPERRSHRAPHPVCTTSRSA
jgi:hypothetical protein